MNSENPKLRPIVSEVTAPVKVFGNLTLAIPQGMCFYQQHAQRTWNILAEVFKCCNRVIGFHFEQRKVEDLRTLR